MKFWYDPSKNFTGPTGRYIWQQVGSGTGQPENTSPQTSIRERLLAETNREAAILDTSAALSQLQAQVESSPDKLSDLPTAEQVQILVRIARNNNFSDSKNDDRSLWEKARDNVGSVLDDYLSTEIAQNLQWATNLDNEAYVLNHITPEAKSRFLADYRHDALQLFTDRLNTDGGKISYKADFFGDTDLAKQASFTELLPPEPDHKYLQINSNYYVRTEQGYIAFSPSSEIGNRARVGNGTFFSVFGNNTLDQNKEVAAELSGLKENNDLFRNIDNSELMAKLEFNRNTNFYTTQTWKSFADNLPNLGIPTELPFSATLMSLFEEGAVFRKFLDGDRALKNYNTEAATPFSITGLDGSVPGLSASMEPTEFRKGIVLALKLIEKFIKQETGKYQQAIQQEKDPSIQADMLNKLQQLGKTVPSILDNIDALALNAEKENKAMLNENAKLILSEFENLTPEQLNTWLSEFDIGMEKLSENFSTKELEAHMGTLLARVLGMAESEGDQLLQNNPQLKNLLLSRINTLSRAPGIDHMKATIQVGREQFYVQSTIQQLQQLSPQLVEGMDTENLSAEDLKILIKESRRLQESLRMRQLNDTLSAQEVELLAVLKKSIPYLEGAKSRIETSRQQQEDAAISESGFRDIVARAAPMLDPKTPQGAALENAVNIGATYSRNYRLKNGETAPFTAENFQTIQTRLEAGESPAQISLSLDPNFQTTPSAQQAVLTASINTIPAGTNFVGLTPDNQFIIQSSGTDKTRFIQNPKSKEIIAESLLNIPDAEDLVSINWPLAQVYAAVTGGNVTQGLARLTAQSAEHGGQESMGQYMANLMNDMYRDPNYTFSPNQLHQWEQLGQRMTEYDLTLDQVFSRLGGGYSIDGTLNTSQTPDGPKLIALLEASVAEERGGFENILGINTQNRLA